MLLQNESKLLLRQKKSCVSKGVLCTTWRSEMIFGLVRSISKGTISSPTFLVTVIQCPFKYAELSLFMLANVEYTVAAHTLPLQEIPLFLMAILIRKEWFQAYFTYSSKQMFWKTQRTLKSFVFAQIFCATTKNFNTNCHYLKQGDPSIET